MLIDDFDRLRLEEAGLSITELTIQVQVRVEVLCPDFVLRFMVRLKDATQGVQTIKIIGGPLDGRLLRIERQGDLIMVDLITEG